MKFVRQILSVAVSLALPVSSLARPAGAATSPSAGDVCPARSLLLDFDVYRWGELVMQAPVWRIGDGSAFFFTSGLMIDADGAPNAYNADDTGLDYLFNAGQPGQWDGIVQDENGEPAIQGRDDPFPGYYISCTALFDRTKHRRDASRFVDATRIPYVALPGDLARQTGARLGDLAFVFSEQTRKYSYAIFADIGVFGEGSVALAENLGIRSDARRGGAPAGISYVVFPGSGDGQPKSVDEIYRLGGALVAASGGAEKILSCAGFGGEKAEPTPDAVTDPPTQTPAATPSAHAQGSADAAAN